MPLNHEGTLPQSQFRDLYTIAYELLDDAKSNRNILKLYKGSHLSPQPMDHVLQFGNFFTQKRRGLFSFACSAINPSKQPSLHDLEAFDKVYTPRISVKEAFIEYYAAYAKTSESPESLLTYVCNREHKLGAYRGGGSGLEDETLAFIAQHFKSQGVPAQPKDVMVFGGGFKGAMMAFCASIFCRNEGEALHGIGGSILVPEGYYQSLRLMPPLFTAKLSVVKEVNANSITTWLGQLGDTARKAIYVPLVNNANGAVLSQDQAYQIAQIVLEYNQANPRNPIYVVGDDVYVGSYLDKTIGPKAIGAVKGADFGRPGLGSMFDWSLSIVTSSKTFALPTSRLSFAASGSNRLKAALAHYRTVFSYGRVPQFNELTATAAICLTPNSWIEHWNSQYRLRLKSLASAITTINQQHKFAAFDLKMPQGGWYMPLRISRALLPSCINSNIAALSATLHYNTQNKQGGLGLLSGELFGYMAHKDPREMFALRGRIAVTEDELLELTNQLNTFAAKMTGPDRTAIATYSLARLHDVAPDINQVLEGLEY